VLRQGLRGAIRLLRPLRHRADGEAGPGEETVIADVQDFAATHASMKGIDCVIHLARCHRVTWEQILPINIAGTYNVFEAARQQA